MKQLNLVGLLALAAQAATADERFDGLDQYVSAAMQRWEVPGVAIAVVKDGEVVLARGYGVCVIGTDRKVTKDTVFTIASCTKSVLSACVGMLVEEGKLAWDDPVVKHLPRFELANQYLTEHVTLRDLLCHRTGLRRADLLGDGAGFNADEILDRLKLLEPYRRIAHAVHLQQSHVCGPGRGRDTCFWAAVGAIRPRAHFPAAGYGID